MGTRTFTLTASVASPAERVIDFLAALDRPRGAREAHAQTFRRLPEALEEGP